MAKKEATISVVEAAKRLETTERTITRYITAGKLKASTELNERNQKRYLVFESSIASFITNKDNADRLIEAGIEGLSGSKAGDNTPVEPDIKPDTHADNKEALTVVGLLTGRIDELKNEVKDWQEKYERRESDVQKAAFQLGSQEQKILELEARTSTVTNANSHTDHADIVKVPGVLSTPAIRTLSVLVVCIFLVGLAFAIMKYYPILMK